MKNDFSSRAVAARAIGLAAGLLFNHYAVAATIDSGQLTLHFDRDALASLNLHDPEADPPGLYLEEFFDQHEAAIRTRAATLTDHLVPGDGEIPADSLRFGVNGPTVTNLERRRSQPTDFEFLPSDVPGSATGHIGLGGVMRFRGDFQGIFVIGDLTLEFDAARPSRGVSGWTLTNHYDFKSTTFDTRNVTMTASPDGLPLQGTLVFDPDTAAAFFPKDRDTPLGTFSFVGLTPVPLPASMLLLGSGLLGTSVFFGRGSRA